MDTPLPLTRSGACAGALPLALLALTLALAGCDSEPGAATEPDAAAAADSPETAAEADAPADAGPDAATDAIGPDASDPGHPSLAWAVDEDGPFKAGYRRLEITYQPEGVPDPRTIPVALWYPSEDTEGERAVYIDLFEQEDVFVDASLAAPPDGEAYPMHVHSHGHYGFAGATPSLMRYFATHGWVVAAPDHTGNTIFNNGEPRSTAIYFLRGLDISAVLDHLGALEAPDPLAGKLALDAVVMSGHSFGGYTTFSVAGATFDTDAIEAGCAEDEGPGGPCTAAEIEVFRAGVRDERVVAAIPMAAGNKEMFGEQGYQSVAVPVLQLTGDDDEQVTHAGQSDPIWGWLTRPDAIRVDIAGGCHQIFGVGACSKISDEIGFGIVDVYALAFARHHLLGDASVAGILDGSVEVDPHATLSLKSEGR